MEVDRPGSAVIFLPLENVTVMAVVLGIVGYFLTRWIWDIVMWVLERRRRVRLEAERAAMEKRALGK